ncbi:Isopenicillin N synthase [Tistlia consotensis]|uniref:Isopenicillin N synthase n=1 Tax=Tistlia consotensis USBA 355 TaxID=560819 RepID=A0A1Y6CNM0_9PROT|nr:2OG-Fe(II) oxygenase family protein [Tistlia consotensis]SMF77661.1 Isopenicillin N synthase [Tistlia consotensis USBA 355]SNS20885.1 Isopenicillin N synthase [Tistlia consotensis]
MTSIPRVDARTLAAPATARALVAAGRDPGFVVLDGVVDAGFEAEMRLLLRFFALPEVAKRALARRKFEPAHRNVYRGYFPVQRGDPTYKEGIDLGRDALDDGWTPDDGDPLTEATPWPATEPCPGWRESVARAYARFEALGVELLRAVALGLGVAPERPLGWFEGGNSTLRLLRYPPRPADTLPADSELLPDGRVVVGRPHSDSGFVTLLWTDGTGGLQARAPDGAWLDVPGDGLAVNFGQMLSDITGGAIRATEHRVVGGLGERGSVPFFFEPRVEARIEPLLGEAAPFVYGDFLWERMRRFVEFHGVERRL